MSDPALPRSGDLFASRYRIAELLGKGGFGAVFEARDTSLERDVALKVLLRVTDDQALARFLREARATAALSSEHVATIYEVGSTADGPYIVMERLRGCDLQDELDDKHHLPVADAVDHLLQAALGIAHAHARGIIHRDIKPRNLFLARRDDGTTLLKVLDFGIAKSTATDLTQTGTTLGTPRYMAPEQLRSARTVDVRTDVWALGVVLYELLCGKPIFDGDTATELAVAIVIDPHVPLRTRKPELPAALEAIVDRCLAKDPDERYADVHALAVALAPFATAAGNALVPRIERALGDRVAGTMAKSSGATDPTVASPASSGTAATVASPSGTAASSGTAATVASPVSAGTAATVASPTSTGTAATVASLTPSSPPAISAPPARPSRAPIAIAVVAVAALAAVLVLWLRGSGSTPIADAAVVTDLAVVADAAIVADTTVVAQDLDAAAVDVAIVADVAAPVDVPARATPRPPTDAEIEAIRGVCLGNAAPLFLVAGNDGPMPYQCGRMALLGCAGLARGCRTRPETDVERKTCRDFQAKLKAAGICR